jgi:hypothetical protein
MSEYQYYEFLAIDRPLTETQKSKISALSSRAHITSHMASFVYSYGDFQVLYLAWLKAAENALGLEGIDKDTMEPPVPPGLNQLSDALKTFVRFLVPLEKYFYIHGKNIFYYVSNPTIGMALRRILTSSNFLNSSDSLGVRKGSHVKMKHPDGRKIVFP